MQYGQYNANGVPSGLDELANLAMSFGGAAEDSYDPNDPDDIAIGADVGEDLESDLEDEEEEDTAAAGSPSVSLQEALPSLLDSRRDRGVVNYDEQDQESEGSARMDEDFEEDDDDDDDSVTFGREAATPAADGMSYDLQAMFPAFQPGAILNFTDLLSAPPKKRARLDAKTIKVRLPDVSDVPLAPSTLDRAVDSLHPASKSRIARLLASLRPRRATQEEQGQHADEAYAEASQIWEFPRVRKRRNAALEVDDWEDRVVWHTYQQREDLDMDLDERQRTRPVTSKRLPFRNEAIDSGDWTRGVIWSRTAPYNDFSRLQLNVAETMVEDDEDEDLTAEKRRQLLSGEVDPFNISNDRIYEAARERRVGVRQTLSSLEVQHAYPAKKLQLPFYKIQLSKSDARAFHRPALQFPVNLPITFSKVRSTKKKRDKVSGHKLRAGEDVMHSTADLSLRDTGPFVLLEFSEEYPPIMSNLGMGSILVNYYRRRNEKEEISPADFGETFVLEPSDETPFRKFGDVKPGETVQALYNDVIRAPVFRHDAASTDYLVVKVSGDGETRYYIREIKNLFVVGQTLPLKEVPGPHSRRLTALTKARLMLIARRLCAKSGDGRCHIQQLLKYFDDHSPLQMRQRIKDFMDFVSNGQWAFKPLSGIPSELDNREVASPEELVLYEAMQVGQRHLLDLGYGQAAGAEGGNDDDESKLDAEQQLAPWTSTKNFMLASQSKAMLALNGEGEPTGRGEGFSFLRISMKNLFIPAGVDAEDFIQRKREEAYGSKKYNVQEQQDLYKAEINKIWAAQAKALKDPVPPRVTAEDEARGRDETPGGTPFAADSPASRANTPGADFVANAGKSGKVLKIRRKVGDQIITERIKDTKVIQAYLRQRQIIEDETLAPEDIEYSVNPDENERNKAKLKKVLASLKRNQQRRQQRRLLMASAGGANVAAGNDDEATPAASGSTNKKAARIGTATSRVCGNCGLSGHMKTNKACPRYHEFYPGGAPKRQPKGAAVPTALSETAEHARSALAASTSATGAGSPPAEPSKLKMSLSDLK